MVAAAQHRRHRQLPEVGGTRVVGMLEQQGAVALLLEAGLAAHGAG